MDLHIMLSVLDGRRPPRPAECSDWLWTIIVRCWCEDSTSRLTASEVAALLAQPLSTSLARSKVFIINGEADDYLPQKNAEPRRQDEWSSPPYTVTTKNSQKFSLNEAKTPVKRRRTTFPSRDSDEPPPRSQEIPVAEAQKNEAIEVAGDAAHKQPEVCYTLNDRFL